MQVEISNELMEELRSVAREQGRSESEVMEDAVRRYVYTNARTQFSEPELLFDRIDQWQREQGVEPLSEDEAMRLANEELHAWRRERRASR